MRGAGSAGCNAELEAPKLCILCIVLCWVAIFLIFFLSGCWAPQKMLIWDLKNTPSGSPTLLLGLFRCQILVFLYSKWVMLHQALNHVKM